MRARHHRPAAWINGAVRQRGDGQPPRRRADDWLRIAAEPGARLHLYGKDSIRPGRKMGHVTRLTAPGAMGDSA